jgi:hypothetical protein
MLKWRIWIQPTKILALRTIRRPLVRVSIPLYEPVLDRDMETFRYNRDCAYANRLAVLDEGLQLLMPSVRCEEREELVRWIYVWAINLEWVGSAECRPLRCAWERADVNCVPSFNYAPAFDLKRRKITLTPVRLAEKVLGIVPSFALAAILRATFRIAFGWGLRSVDGRHKYLSRCRTN